jgi:hypothetical protein
MQREVLANQLDDARPTVDAVHDAVVQAGYHGLTYAPIAGALQSTETRVQRWAVGADIPTTVSERRAILSTLQRLLSELPSAPDRRRKTIDGKRETRTQRNERLATVLCMQCQRVASTGDTCGRRACRRVA